MDGGGSERLPEERGNGTKSIRKLRSGTLGWRRSVNTGSVYFEGDERAAYMTDMRCAEYGVTPLASQRARAGLAGDGSAALAPGSCVDS